VLDRRPQAIYGKRGGGYRQHPGGQRAVQVGRDDAAGSVAALLDAAPTTLTEQRLVDAVADLADVDPIQLRT
jgi:hypothetical protein